MKLQYFHCLKAIVKPTILTTLQDPYGVFIISDMNSEMTDWVLFGSPKEMGWRYLDRTYHVQLVEIGCSSFALTFAAKSAHVILVLYSVCNKDSFNKATYCLDQFKGKNNLLLVSQDCDPSQPPVVTSEEGRLAAQEHGVPFLGVNANGIGVPALRKAIASLLSKIPPPETKRSWFQLPWKRKNYFGMSEPKNLLRWF